MSSEPYTHIEQDYIVPDGGDGLPTYDDLAAQNGPNSRFGRWRGWIEKRAAERYNDLTLEERERRRERGWGNEDGNSQVIVPPGGLPAFVNQPPTPGPTNLYIQTSGLSINDAPPVPHIPDLSDSPLPPLPFISQQLSPTHLKINHFGSRFLPHTTSQIRCILPLLSDKLLLIGHDEGLSVLDMFPQEWSEAGGINVKGPDEAQSRLIWQGESVYQMTILEMEDIGDDIPQGVVLALVGPEAESSSGKDCSEAPRSLRMYNLASLTSLAKWAVAQKGARPLKLHRPSNWQAQQTPTKKHRPQSSIARGLKSLIDVPHPNHSPEPNTSSYHTLLSPSSSSSGPNLLGRRSPSPVRGSPIRQNSDESSWDVVEDLPLRWATDFVPLATAGSRLAGASVLSYAIWTDENRKGRGGQLLAIATKYNILLYETPKGERAFRFVKEFYTPLQPRNISFFQQSVQEVTRSTSDAGPGRFQSHRRSDSAGTLRAVESRNSASNTLNYGTQLSLFVVFDKKAGWIRLADSAVGEIDLYDDKGAENLYSHTNGRDTLTASTLRSKARLSFDIHGSASKWVPITRCEVPIPGQTDGTRKIHFLTRGKKTHITACPLPTQSALYAPLHVVQWHAFPKHISVRVCEPPASDDRADTPFLQLVAFGQNGIEVQELPLAFLSTGKGKSRALFDDPVWVEEDLGGEAGFLSVGGHWDQIHRLLRPGLQRSYSATSDMSGYSFNSMESEDIVAKMRREEGLYGWCRKGATDWRVFWLGGVASSNDDTTKDER
ncbi:hypothetical protein BDQ12DRAFT_643609 [Crucibulum laeve]|uniref:Uncharacterized protein n=1 Tax=Crucibulum laeve TaxID=68775 RepID=A0A5C3MFZ8_9AGAR|nr:hypothetical protein BDQ12DRAFT_643609 [Crucibulum laeve]